MLKGYCPKCGKFFEVKEGKDGEWLKTSCPCCGKFIETVPFTDERDEDEDEYFASDRYFEDGAEAGLWY